MRHKLHDLSDVELTKWKEPNNSSRRPTQPLFINSLAPQGLYIWVATEKPVDPMYPERFCIPGCSENA
jgi:hypothetical protein